MALDVGTMLAALSLEAAAAMVFCSGSHLWQLADLVLFESAS